MGNSIHHDGTDEFLHKNLGLPNRNDPDARLSEADCDRIHAIKEAANTPDINYRSGPPSDFAMMEYNRVKQVNRQNLGICRQTG